MAPNPIKQFFKTFALTFFGALILFPFQNCSKNEDTLNTSQSITRLESQQGNLPGIEADGNGAGYTGKLSLIAPKSIQPGIEYVITILGGTAPYQISSPQGTIQIVERNGTLRRLRNNFRSGLNSFELIVTDAEGERVSTTIDILASDNIFNYRRSSAMLKTDNHYLVFDSYMKKAIVFENNGLAVNMLHPNGNILQEFSASGGKFGRDSVGNILFLDWDTTNLYFYRPDFSFWKTLDLSQFPDIDMSRSFTIYNDIIHIVEEKDLEVHQIDIDGIYLGKLNLDTGGLQGLTSIAFNQDTQEIYLADKAGATIRQINSNGSYVDITQIPLENGQSYNLIGPRDLNIANNGDLFFADENYIWGSNLTTNQTTVRLRKQSNNSWLGKEIAKKDLDRFIRPTNCLDTHNSSVYLCNAKSNVAEHDLDGNLIKTVFARIGGGSGVSEPEEITVDEDGNFFISSDKHYVVGINSKMEIMYRQGGWGSTDYKFKNISGIQVQGDRLYVASSTLQKVKVFNKYTFDFLFEFNLVNSQNQIVTPQRMTSNESHLFIGTGNQGIFVFDLEGTQIRQISTFTNSPSDTSQLSVRDIKVDKLGRLFVKNKGGELWVVDTVDDSLLHRKFYPHGEHRHLAIKEDGTLFMNDRNRILLIDTDTWDQIDVIGASGMIPGTFNYIAGLDTDEDFLYVCDQINQRVQRIKLPKIK